MNGDTPQYLIHTTFENQLAIPWFAYNKTIPGQPSFYLKKKEQNKTKKHNTTRAEEGGNYVRKYTFFFIKTFINIIITIFLYFARLLQRDFVLFSHF